jgi:hypothetical protein
MPNVLSPDEIGDAARSLRRMLQRYTDARADDPESWIAIARVVAERLRGEWGSLCAQVRKGTAANDARATGLRLAGAIDDWIEVAQVLLREGGRLTQQSAEPVKGLSQLEADAGALREIGGATRKLVDSVNQACGAPLDPKQIEEAEAAFAQGQYKQGQDVIARLRRPRGG